MRAKALERNKKLIQYEAVKSWNGKMPGVILGNGTMPLLNLNDLNK